MKVYSIGRESGCDIVINDNTDVISRRHAILSVDQMGKMTITDQSQNGTYVNGIRLASNVAVPVTRKDNVSFAQISRLDWNLIPNPTTIYKYIAFSILGIAFLCLLAWGGITLFGGDRGNEPQVETTTGKEKNEQSEEEIKKKEEARQDSLRQAIQDSIRQAIRDSKPKVRKKNPTPAPQPSVQEQPKKKQNRIR